VIFHLYFILSVYDESRVWKTNMKQIITGIVAIAALLINSTAIAMSETISQGMPHRGDGQGGMEMGMGMMSGAQGDRNFIEMMIPHHDGAVKMADLILKRTKRPELRQLATAIKRDQTREISQMKTWYQQWYKTSVPSNPKSGGMGMGMMSGGGMANMMTAQVQKLATTSEPGSDRVFLEEMIPHHKMALMMTSHIVDSDRPELRTLAKNIMQTQTAEIEQMRQWYNNWYQKRSRSVAN
jgi:uncharacterized protein (DUF305 family)